MGTASYYEVLGVGRVSSTEEIKKAYRKMALKFHPDRSPGTATEVQLKFDAIAEAYDVLSNAARRAIYDQYGESGLKQGIPDGEGGVRGGIYQYSYNAVDIFTAFFGTSSPFADIMGETGEEAPAFYGELTGMQLPQKPQQPPPLELPLSVSLSELYVGATKKLSYSRRVLREDVEHVTEEQRQELHVRVCPGMTDGTAIVFPKMGNEAVDALPQDVVVLLAVDGEAYPAWEQDGVNLFFSHELSLADALAGSIVEVPTLDGRLLSVPVTQIVAPGETKVVPGEGMPSLKDPAVKGDLILKFEIKFPKTLTPAQKAAIKKALK